MATWSLGPITVTRIEELLGPANVPPGQYLAGFDRALVERHRDWLVPNHYLPAQDRLVTSIHSWLIRTGRHTILLDCCGGNHKNRPFSPRFHRLDTPFIDRLAAAGARPDDIDIVLCTHLHADHVGWNTVRKDGAWVPTFPRARYLFSRIESRYWDAAQNAAMRGDPRREAYDDSVLPVVARGQAELIDGIHALEDGITIEPAPGHTPGHVMLRIVRNGARGVFCGDAIHHPLQVYAPHWNHAADERPEEAALTRRRLLEHCAEQQAWLFPTHFGAPHVVAIKDVPDGFAARFITGRNG